MRILITITFLSLSSFVFGQAPKHLTDSLKIAQIDKTLNQYDGDKDQFYKLIQSNLDYPVWATRYGSQGISVVSFTIDGNGNSINHEIVNAVGNGCSEEVIRIVKLAKWKPDSMNSRYEVAIAFKLEDFDSILQKAYKNSKKLYLKQKYEESIPQLNTIITLNPYDVEALKRRCIAYYKTGQIDNACVDNIRYSQLGQPKIEGIECK